MNIELFYSPGACSFAPHVALEESGLDYKTYPVPVKERAHLMPEYLAVNPRGRVPALRIEGEVITEVPALLELIADLALSGPALLPTEPLLRGRAFEWMCFLSSSVHIGFAQLWRPERFLPPGADAALLNESGKANLARWYEEIEERIGDGPWVMGEAYTVVDPYLAVFWRWGKQRLDWDMESRFPAWSGHTCRLRHRPAVQRVLADEGITME